MPILPASAKPPLWWIFLLASLVLIPSEYFCAASSLETQGEVMQALYELLLWLNVIWIGVAWWAPRAALVGTLSLAALIVPYQVVLLNRFTRINNEIIRLVDSRMRMRAEGKLIPVTLDDYRFTDPSIRKHIANYYVMDGGANFSLFYFVIDAGTTHSYSSQQGWDYYPD